jgi:Patatin-like phospholipase
MSETKKTFHLAITMAGAISAGAYTAGVMDYLLEALDNWAEMRQKANEFFAKYPFLKDVEWEVFMKTPEFAEISKAGKNLEDLRKRAVRYNAVPHHDIQIEIMSGASAGGMTAAIASLILQLENKYHVKFLPDVKDKETLKELDEIKENNRLYNSWVNLTNDDMLSVLLGDSDIKIAGKPVSALNSQFIRQVSERALQIDETDNVIVSPYVSEDFNLFVTLTNLEGYQKSLNIDSSGQRDNLKTYGDFITYNHSDLVMFSFGENEDAGTVHIDFNRKNDKQNDENIKLLGNAAVATGAFPIGLEYASFSRKPEFINNNFLIRQIHSDTRELVETDKNYLTTFIDGGLINNEPFELTDCLLKERLKQKLKNSNNPELKVQIQNYMNEFRNKLQAEYKEGVSPEEMDSKMSAELNRWLDTEVKKQKNYTILMIDPFPSERKPPAAIVPDTKPNYYPFDLIGVIKQLVATMRSQLLVKTNLFNSARDVNDFSCYLIAPRRRTFQKEKDGTIKRDKNNKPVPVYEKDANGEIIIDENGKPISKAYDGSAAIACGGLGGFGGFLDKRFREHDFYLGRINCQSFLRRHFRIKSDGENSIENAVTLAYSETSKKIFQTECGAEYVPIIPEIHLLKEHTLLSTENPPLTPDDLYCKLPLPKYDMNIFNNSKDKVLGRIWTIIDSIMKNNNLPWATRKYIQFGFWKSKNTLFEKLSATIRQELKDWELIK